MNDDSEQGRYELVLGPPPRAGGGPLRILEPDGPVMQNLYQLAAMPETWGRIAVYAARTTAYDVVSRLRKPNYAAKLPSQGTWEFRAGLIPETREYGVWARFVPDQPAT